MHKSPFTSFHSQKHGSKTNITKVITIMTKIRSMEKSLEIKYYTVNWQECYGWEENSNS